MDYTLVAIVGTICMSAVILGNNWVKTGRNAHPAIVKSEKNWEKYARDLEEQLDNAEKDIKSLVGKLHAKESPPQFKGELNKDNMGEMISSFFPMFADKIPGYLQPFFKNPMIQKFAIDWALKNPEQAMGFFGKFFSKDLGRPRNGNAEPSQSGNTGLPEGAEIF